jgi:pSer/pThr/pTyr-binding forkhead associated (FHA) protein
VRICPYCSTENEAFFRFCLGCGADLDEVAPEEPAPVVVTAPKRVGADPAPKKTAAEPTTVPAAVREAAAGSRRGPDTVKDAPAVTPEMLAAAETSEVPRPITAGGVMRPHDEEPRPVDRAKTFDGGQVKIGNPALHAVGKAQLELSKKQPIGVSSREEKVEGPTKRAGGTPELAAPVAKRESPAGQPTTQPRAVEPKKAKVEVKKPKSSGRLVLILEDGSDGVALDLLPTLTVIGREGVDLPFPHDDFLARRHAEFYFEDGALWLRPLESTNGVFVQVHQEVELESGDIFRIGQQLLSFEMLSAIVAELEEDPRGQAIPLGSPIPEGAWGRLGQLIAPDTLGSVYLLGGTEVYLGRERGDITFPGDGFVSGLHAQITQRGGRCFLKDLGSSNGTYLRLTGPAQVQKGTLVLAGQQLFRVEL